MAAGAAGRVAAGDGSFPCGEIIQPGRFKPPASSSPSSPPSRPQRCLLRPLQPSAPRHSRGEARQRQPLAIRPFSSSSSSGLIAPVFFHGGGELPLDLVFFSSPDMPPRPRTRRPGPCIPRLPPLLCIPVPAAHTQRRRGGAREAGAAVLSPGSQLGSEGGRAPEPLRHRASAGRGKGWRALIPAPLLALRGREAGGSERRVSSPSASQLTASKQPFLKANCHRRAEPPPAPRPAWIRPSLGGGSGGVTAPPGLPRAPLPPTLSEQEPGGAGAAPGMQRHRECGPRRPHPRDEPAPSRAAGRGAAPAPPERRLG